MYYAKIFPKKCFTLEYESEKEIGYTFKFVP